MEEPHWLSSRRPSLTYQRRKRKSRNEEAEVSDSGDDQLKLEADEIVDPPKSWCSPIKTKRTIAAHPKRQQYFLDFGQSDFSYTTCSVCGLMYARGEESDQKVHEIYHRGYVQGIQFKGWRNERVALMLEKGSRIVVVLPDDSMQHQNKVKEVATVMERDMGFAPGWLIHSKCKVYLYVASRRLLGCAVAEPIQEAYPVMLDSPSNVSEQTKENIQVSNKEILFGGIKFVREVHRKRKTKQPTSELGSSVVCRKETVPAVCGIRGIWVMHSARRSGIASTLVDTIRQKFQLGSCELQKSEIAFSQPSADGIAFASRYCNNKVLVYQGNAA